MRRPSDEVNGSRTRAARSLVATCVLAGMLASCHGTERRAERLWRHALDLVAKGDTSGAVVELQRILDEYPDTEVAAKARKQIVLYRGLETAVLSYPSRRAREVMVQVARAIEGFKAKERRVPGTLDELVPKRLDAIPRDPWDHALEYQPRERGYRLVCRGSDGAAGGEGDAADVVVVDGAFVAARP
jgi:hypothetical protein